jgi:hypothetical protein
MNTAASLDHCRGAHPTARRIDSLSNSIDRYDSIIMKTLSLLKPALAAIAIVSGCALAVAGCGGSSSGDSGNGGGDASTLSKSEFIEQADAICAKATKEVETEFASYLKSEGIEEIGGKGESPAEEKARQTEVVETVGVPALRKQAEEIEALGLPSEDGEQVEKYLASVKEGIAEGEQNPTVLYASSEKIFAQSDKIAGEIGFKVCGNH